MQAGQGETVMKVSREYSFVVRRSAYPAISTFQFEKPFSLSDGWKSPGTSCWNRKGANHLAPSLTFIALRFHRIFPPLIRGDSRRSLRSPSQSGYRRYRRFQGRLYQ